MLNGLPRFQWIGRARVTFVITKFLTRTRDVDRALASNASPSLVASSLTGFLAL